MDRRLRKRLAHIHYRLNDLVKYDGTSKGSAANGNTRILVYHGVDDRGFQGYNSRFIGLSRFKEDLELIKANFNVLSLEELVAGEVSSDQFNVVLTFDDGYFNNLTLVLPILEELGLSATFCVTGIIDTDFPILWADYLDLLTREYGKTVDFQGVKYRLVKKRPWSKAVYQNDKGETLKELLRWSNYGPKKAFFQVMLPFFGWEELNPFSLYWQQMNAEGLKRLASYSGAEIAAHGLYHNNLNAIPHQEACEEMKMVKSFLESTIGKSVSTFSFPEGAHNKALIEHGKSIGYTTFLLAEDLGEGVYPDQSIWNRMTIHPYISSLNQTNCIIKGRYYEQ